MSSEYAEELDLELTAEEEEQLNAIERDLALSAAAPAIAASPPSHPPAASAYMPPAPSLYDTYRRTRGWGSLSVSDLTSLIWCETRLGYSLSSRAHLPTADRPTSLISTNGVEVRLDARRSQARDAILEKGRVVHQVLEDALLVDVVQVVEVVAKDKEEWWTLKILDTMANLERLLQTGVVVSLASLLVQSDAAVSLSRHLAARAISLTAGVSSCLTEGSACLWHGSRSLDLRCHRSD